MSTKKAGTIADFESNHAMYAKAPNNKAMKTAIESKQVMSPKKWDVSAIIGRYLSTDFVVSDAKEEYRILKNDTIMLEFDGLTTIRKAFVNAEGFFKYPFELVDFDSIKPTNNKYLIGELLLLYLLDRDFIDAEIPVLKTLRLYENRYRLELDISDDTTHVVVVLFDKPTTTLVKCFAVSIAKADDEMMTGVFARLYKTSLALLMLWKSSRLPTTSMETLKVLRAERLIRLK
uniref:Uncharacterized protein n=1 Tax=Tanacetum cinerariifolium TaxID=118510 RepID=A0A6L2NUP7_TANCI|nr:hypothetical protein [Tanacetum cinerariifolium]